MRGLIEENPVVGWKPERLVGKKQSLCCGGKLPTFRVGNESVDSAFTLLRRGKFYDVFLGMKKKF